MLEIIMGLACLRPIGAELFSNRPKILTRVNGMLVSPFVAGFGRHACPTWFQNDLSRQSGQVVQPQEARILLRCLRSHNCQYCQAQASDFAKICHFSCCSLKRVFTRRRGHVSNYLCSVPSTSNERFPPTRISSLAFAGRV